MQDTSDKTDPGSRRTDKKDSEERNIGGLCEQCFRGNQESVSTRWCLDCDEPLCSVCDAAHHLNKTSMSHTTIVKEIITNVSSAFVQIEKLCKNHPDIEVGFYCNVHSVLCCINCIPELHRSCDGVISLDDAAKTIEKSSSLNKITEEIECILETLQNLQHDFKNNISNIQQEESVQHAVAQLKSKVVDHLNNLEKDMLSQLLVIKDHVVSNINAEIAALNPFVNEMTSIKTDIDFMIEHGARKHAFLLCQKLKEEMEAKHIRLTEIISSHRHFSLSFKPSVKIDQLIAKINSFGVITVTEEPKQIADKRHTSAQGNVVTNQ